jgi:hypothetical protein
MQYARGYGVFDHWNKALSSFGPSWNALRPCQTQFGIEGGVHSPVQDFPAQTPTTECCVDAVDGKKALQNSALPAVIPTAAGRHEGIYGRKIR